MCTWRHLPTHTAQISSTTFSFSPTHARTHTVILACTHRLVSFGQSTVEERVHCRQVLECWNIAKVQGCNSSHEHRHPPPTILRLEVGLPVRLKLKMDLGRRNGLGTGLQEGQGIMLWFYHRSREVAWKWIRNGACGLDKVLKLCTTAYCNPGALPLVGLGRELGRLEIRCFVFEEVEVMCLKSSCVLD